MPPEPVNCRETQNVNSLLWDRIYEGTEHKGKSSLNCKLIVGWECLLTGMSLTGNGDESRAAYCVIRYMNAIQNRENCSMQSSTSQEVSLCPHIDYSQQYKNNRFRDWLSQKYHENSRISMGKRLIFSMDCIPYARI